MKSNSLKNMSVAEIVTENISTSHIFKKYGIDFCCGGGISLKKACAINKVSLGPVIADLLSCQSTSTSLDYNSLTLYDLIDHIKTTHHVLTKQNLKLLKQYANKVNEVHGKSYPNLSQLKAIIDETAAHLLDHLKKEEEVIFPLIIRLENDDNLIADEYGYDSFEKPMSELFEEHDETGATFMKISKLTNNYTPPTEACNTFKAFYNLLSEFENDLHLHVHLENNILFPKAKHFFSKLKRNVS